MALTLVTGPANAAKAQVVLERFRAALGRAPLLIVPRAADVEHYRRELAQTGAVLGVAVEAVRRPGARDRPPRRPRRAGDLRRRRASTSSAPCARAERLEVLAAAARAPGFVRSLAALVAELEARRVAPGALRLGAARLGARGRARATPRSSRASTAPTARRLERLGLLDAELAAARALDVLARSPERWGRTPVFCYGFDDLEPLQLDAIETLAHARRRAGHALAPRRARPRRARRSRGDARDAAPARRARSSSSSRWTATTRRRRSTTSSARCSRTVPQPRPAGDAVALLEGGDERAEAELVAAEIAALIDDGCPAGEIAVVTRGSAAR